MEQPPRSTYQDDEISLVDLAKILIHRRWWFFGASSLIVVLAFIFVLLTRGEPAYQYTSIYQQAETEPGESITSSASVIQQIESLYWPNYQRRYKEENDVDKLPFGLEINNPEDTTLITLKTTAAEVNYNQIVNMHEMLLDSAVDRQAELLERKRSQLESSIERISTLLERVENADSDASVEIAANYSDRLFELERELQNLTDGEVLEYATQGDQQSKTLNEKIVLVLGIVLGGIAGIIAAFFAEFVFRVKESLAEEKEA